LLIAMSLSQLYPMRNRGALRALMRWPSCIGQVQSRDSGALIQPTDAAPPSW
jgi:hypothetical protein